MDVEFSTNEEDVFLKKEVGIKLVDACSLDTFPCVGSLRNVGLLLSHDNASLRFRSFVKVLHSIFYTR